MRFSLFSFLLIFCVHVLVVENAAADESSERLPQSIGEMPDVGCRVYLGHAVKCRLPEPPHFTGNVLTAENTAFAQCIVDVAHAFPGSVEIDDELLKVGSVKDRCLDSVDLVELRHRVAAAVREGVPDADQLRAFVGAGEIDVAFVGIGENGHLAFNDPPADFDTELPYIVVELDDACRQQQFGEGWFASLDEVPETAISMSVQQIMKSETIICTVPDKRKARAVKQCFEGEISSLHPASILRKHPRAFVYLDCDAASLLSSVGEN